MKKQFLKIAGVSSEAAFYKKYPTEGAFFAAHPEARKMAMGGTPEAFPQIATFDKAFSYGVPPGPQYLSHGGSAYPQAQTEQQFFIPIYTDVYNPYNKAMGGSNVEMYPNAKTTPHWGPSNVWFQDGGQGGMEQPQPELERLGAQNRTGAFATILKQTAAKANAKNAMMGTMNNMGMAKYGKQLDKYQGDTAGSQTGATPPAYLTKDDLDAWWKGVSQQQSQAYPGYYPAFYPGQQINFSDPRFYPPINPTGNMGNFLNDYFAYTTGSPYAGSTTKGRVSVDGQRAGNFYGNMPLIKAMMPELYGKGNFADMMTNNAEFRNRAEAMGLTNYKEPTGLKKLFGSREYTFNQRVPWEAPTVTLGPKPTAPQNTTSMSVNDLITMIDGMPSQTPGAASPAQSSSGVPPMLQNNPAYSQPAQSNTWQNPVPGMMPSAAATTNTKIPFSPAPAASSSSPAAPASTGYMSPESYNVINQFENTVGTYDAAGNPIGMGKGDDYAQTEDKEKIESFINTTIGKDTWDKLPENVKTQAYSFMFNNGVTKKDGTTNYNALNGLAQAIDNATGGGDLGDQRRAYTPEQAINKIKGADLSNPDLYNNYVNVLGDQYGSVATNTDKFKSGPGANYVPTLQRRAVSIDEIMNSRGMNSKSASAAKSQAPSNATSMDAATAQKKASMMSPNVNQAYIDDQRAAAAPQVPFDPNKVTAPNYPGNPVIPAQSMADQGYMWKGKKDTYHMDGSHLWQSFPPSSGSDYSNILDDGRPWDQGYSTMGVYGETPNAASYISAPPYRTPVGPVVGPDGYAYGGNTGYKFGGSYKKGDVVYMSDDEIAEFIRNGGQVEEME
jgi:hypothetical protein